MCVCVSVFVCKYMYLCVCKYVCVGMCVHTYEYVNTIPCAYGLGGYIRTCGIFLSPLRQDLLLTQSPHLTRAGWPLSSHNLPVLTQGRDHHRV